MSRLLSSMALRPVLLSALLTGVPVIGLFILQWRFIEQLRTASTNVVQQAMDDSAEVLALQIRRDFGWPAFNLLERIDHRDVRNLQFTGIARTLAERANHLRFVDRVFIWSKSRNSTIPVVGCDSPSASQLYFLSVPRDGRRSPPDESVSCDQALAAAILDKGMQLAELRSSFTLSDEAIDGRAYQTVYHFLYDQSEQRLGLSAFVGFTVDSNYLRAQYFPHLVSAAIGTGPRSKLLVMPALAISIVDDRGEELYRSNRSLLSNYDGAARFPFLFFDTELLESLSPLQPQIRYWTVRTGFVDGDLAGFVQRQTRPQQALWLVVALGALGGVGLTVRATMREMRVMQLQSEFMSSVSHELKTPLAKIQLFAETLESGRSRTPEKTQEYYSIIRAQAVKLGHLIGTMLEFAKIQAGARHYQLEEIDLRPIVQSVLGSFEEELTFNNFQVGTSFPSHEVPIRGNSEGLEQLFNNLVSNAIKYSPDARHMFVGLSTERYYATVKVTDHGIGIPRSEQKKIFRRFYRVRGHAAHRGATGSGLGLAIVSHVARAHAATVSVESATGEGTTFIVRIPLIAGEGSRT